MNKPNPQPSQPDHAQEISALQHTPFTPQRGSHSDTGTYGSFVCGVPWRGVRTDRARNEKKRESTEEMIEKWIESLKNGQCIPESDLKKLCSMVSSLRPPSPPRMEQRNLF
jgi:hypothetical protein